MCWFHWEVAVNCNLWQYSPSYVTMKSLCDSHVNVIQWLHCEITMIVTLWQVPKFPSSWSHRVTLGWATFDVSTVKSPSALFCDKFPDDLFWCPFVTSKNATSGWLFNGVFKLRSQMGLSKWLSFYDVTSIGTVIRIIPICSACHLCHFLFGFKIHFCVKN